MVAVQASKLLGLSGKAEIPGVVESMSCMSSVCKLAEGVSGRYCERRGSPGDTLPLGDALSVLSTGS